MVNETFWFFYLVEVCARLGGGVAFFFGFFGVLITVAFCIRKAVVVDNVHFENRKEAGKPYNKVIATGVALFTLGILLGTFMPPREAFYGGATQYVAEVTEVDKTLLQLKEIIDKKIKESIDETEDK